MLLEHWKPKGTFHTFSEGRLLAVNPKPDARSNVTPFLASLLVHGVQAGPLFPLRTVRSAKIYKELMRPHPSAPTPE